MNEERNSKVQCSKLICCTSVLPPTISAPGDIKAASVFRGNLSISAPAVVIFIL